MGGNQGGGISSARTNLAGLPLVLGKGDDRNGMSLENFFRVLIPKIS